MTDKIVIFSSEDIEEILKFIKDNIVYLYDNKELEKLDEMLKESGIKLEVLIIRPKFKNAVRKLSNVLHPTLSIQKDTYFTILKIVSKNDFPINKINMVLEEKFSEELPHGLEIKII